MERKAIKIPILAIIYILIFLFAVMNISGLLNSHVLVHIKTGEWMLENHSVITRDIFSISRTGEWINYYWLTDLIYAYLYKNFGIGSILIMHAAIIAGAFSIIALFLYNKKVNIFIAIIFFLIGLYAGLPQWSAIPYSFNFIFLPLFIYWFDKYYEFGEKKYIVLLIILQIFWINMNSEFIYPFIVLFIYIFMDILSLIKKEINDKKGIKRAGVIFLILIPILLMNPYGAKEVVNVLTGYIFMIKDRRNDWAAPDFHGFAKYSNIMLIFSIFIIFIFKKINLIKERKYILLYLTTIFAFLYAQRHIMIFSIISIMFIPLLIEYNKDIPNKIINNLYEKSKMMSNRIYNIVSGTTINILLIVVVTTMFLFNIKGSEDNFNVIMSKWARSSGVSYLKENKIEGNGFHSDVQGDMIIWYNYPKTKVFIDSREGVYSGEYQNKYAKIIMLKDGWEKLLEAKKINWILLQQSQITNIIKMLDDKWIIVYESRVAVLLLKKDYYEKIKNRIEVVKD